MSLFNAKEWWTSGTVFLEETTDLLHDGCVKLSQLGVEGAGDNIIIGNPNGLLQIFRPQDVYQPTHVIIESLMNFTILQVETGKFVFGSDAEHIVVLYPNSLVVYSLITNEGQAEYGNQSILSEQYHHNFLTPAMSLTIGGFGGVKDKDFMCVQCLNGLLMFFEQDVAIFSCLLPESLLPGPTVYSQCTDSFIMFTSMWTIESYSYHNLSQLSQGKVANSKNVMADWIYNIGDTIRTIHKVQTSTQNCSLILIGERTLYCLSDNGVLKFMKRFDFDIVCSFAYLVGWYYDPSARLMTMVVSETSTLLIYEHAMLLWSCQLTFLPVVISRGFFSYLPGTIVAVTGSGEVKCLYLGTEPELFTAPPIIETDLDYDKIQEELEKIQSIINNQNGVGEITLMNKAAEREVPFTVSVNRNFHLHNYEHNIEFPEDQQSESLERLLKCQVTVTINPANKDNIDVINVIFVAHAPFKCSVSNHTCHNLSDDLCVQTDVFVVDNSPIFRNDMSIMVVYVNNIGNVHVLRKNINLPLGLFTQPVRPLKEAKCKVTLNIDKSQIELLDLFKDFGATSFTKVGASNNVLAFESLNFSNDTVTVISAKSTQRYRIQSDGLSLLNIVLLEIVDRFRRYYKRKSLSPVDDDCKILEISVHGGVSSDIMQYFVKTIEKHWKLRQRLFEAEKYLDTLSLQFILIQKRMMIKYREKPPTSCDGIHYLLLNTYQRLDVTSKDIINLRKEVIICGRDLCGSVNLICTVFSMMDPTSEELKLIQWALLPDVLEHEQQNWEETVALNITSLLKDRFAKSDKERDKIVPFNDTDNIKQFDGQKFIKYIQLLFERVLAKYNKLDEAQQGDQVSLHRTLSSDSQQLDTVQEENKSTPVPVVENVLGVPEGSMLGFHKKPISSARWERQQDQE